MPLVDATFVPGQMGGAPPDSIQQIDVTVGVSPHVITEKTLLYDPAENDIVVYRNAEQKTGRIRKIFLNTSLDEEEQQWLSNLREYLKKEDMEFHPLLQKDYLRFLQHAKGNVETTVKLLLANELFKKEFFCPLNDTEILEGLQSGFMYWHGRDRKERPILVVRTARLNPKMKPGDIVRLVGFVLEWMITYGLVPGRVENWTVLVDLKDTGLRSFSLETIRTLVTTLHMNYRFRNTKVLIMNCPWIGSSVYKMISPLLPADTKEKVTFCSVKEAKKILEDIIDAEQLEEQFGGTAKNCEKPEDFYPYRFFPAAKLPPVEDKFPQEYLTNGRLWEVHDNTPRETQDWLKKICVDQFLTPSSCFHLQGMLPEAKGITPATKIQAHLKALNKIVGDSVACRPSLSFGSKVSRGSRRSITQSYADGKAFKKSVWTQRSKSCAEGTLSEAVVAKRGGPTAVPEELDRIQDESMKQTEEETDAELVEMCNRITKLVNGGDVAAAIAMIKVHGDAKEKAVSDGIALNVVSDALHMVELTRNSAGDSSKLATAVEGDGNGELPSDGVASHGADNEMPRDGTPSRASPASGRGPGSGRGTPTQKPQSVFSDDDVAPKGGCCGAGKSKNKKHVPARPARGDAVV